MDWIRGSGFLRGNGQHRRKSLSAQIHVTIVAITIAVVAAMAFCIRDASNIVFRVNCDANESFDLYKSTSIVCFTKRRQGGKRDKTRIRIAKSSQISNASSCKRRSVLSSSTLLTTYGSPESTKLSIPRTIIPKAMQNPTRL